MLIDQRTRELAGSDHTYQLVPAAALILEGYREPVSRFLLAEAHDRPVPAWVLGT